MQKCEHKHVVQIYELGSLNPIYICRVCGNEVKRVRKP